MLHCIQDAENSVQKCWPGILSTWNCWIYRSHNHSGNACNNEGTCEYPTGHSVPLSVELVKCVALVATQTAGQTHASWRYALRGACITRIQSLPVHIALRNKPHIIPLYMATNYALDILPYYPFSHFAYSSLADAHHLGGEDLILKKYGTCKYLWVCALCVIRVP